jgi:hypothetical protein
MLDILCYLMLTSCEGHDADKSWRITRTVKNLWHRIIKSEKPTRNEDWSARQGMPRPSLSFYSDVEAQLHYPIGFPLLETLREEPLPVGGRSVPGAFPTEVAVEALVSVASEPASSGDVEVSIPLANAQTSVPSGPSPPDDNDAIEVLIADEIGEVTPNELTPAPSDVDNAIAPTDPSNIAVDIDQILATRRSSVSSWESLPVISENDTARPPSPDWVSASTQTSLSNASTVVEPASKSDTPTDYDQELLYSIDTFSFSHMASTGTLSLSRKRNFHAMVDMTCKNLLNAGWDLTRLHMIWCDIIEDAPSTEVLETAEPWTRLGIDHIAKACEYVLQAIETYRFWAEQVRCGRAVAITRDVMGEEFWRSFDAKVLEEFDSLRLDNVTSQVELVMERYLRIKKEVKTPTAASEEENTTSTTRSTTLVEAELPSIAQIFEEEFTADEPSSVTALPADNDTASSSEKTQHPPAIAQTTPKPADESQADPTDTNPLPSSLTIPLRKLALNSVPSFAGPTKSSLRASQQTVKSGSQFSKATVNPALQQLAARVRDVRSATRPITPTKLKLQVPRRASPDLPLKIKRRLKPMIPLNEPSIKVATETCAKPQPVTQVHSDIAPERPQSRFKPPSNVPATMRIPLRSDYVHDSSKKPASTLPRSFSPPSVWPTSPPIYSSTTIPLRVNGLGEKRLRFARPRLGLEDIEAIKAENKAKACAKEAVHRGKIDLPEQKRSETADEQAEATSQVDGRSSKGTEVWFDASDVAA